MDEPNTSRLTKKESFLFHNNLVCLVKGLEKRYTTIDLRNEISVTGKIIEVDGYMNIVLEDAAVFDTDDKCRYFPFLHIHARSIRNVHIPTNISITKTIKDQLTEKPKSFENKKRTFKESRAQKQQKETLQLVKEMKEKQKINETSKNETSTS